MSISDAPVRGLGCIMELWDLLRDAAPTTIEVVFLICAILGAGFFLIMMILMLFGGIVGGAIDTVFDTDFSIDSDLSFELFSIQGLSAATMMFGLVGMYTIKAEQSDVLAVFAGGLASVASLYAMKVMMQGIHGLQVDGTMQISDAIGSRGQVYSRIKPNETGEVQVGVKGSLRTMAARAKDKSILIPTGTFIEVVDAIGSTLIVEELTEEE